jgi:uncharacterized integral membrane protein (TIGR00697 family)
MNEWIFFGHTIFVALVVLAASRFGKDALIALSVTFWLITDLFVMKQIVLFGFNVTSSDAFVIGGSLITALITENWGEQTAKKSVYICFSILILFALLSLIHNAYIPSSYDTTHHHFQSLLTPIPRIVFASLAAYITSQLISVSLITFLKKKTQGKFFALRILSVIIFSQIIDTLLFGFIGLYGIVSSLFSIMAISFFMKMIALFITTPLISLSKKIINEPV